MHSVILVGNDIGKKEEYLNDFFKTHHISPFDIYRFHPAEESFGIQLTRDVQKSAYQTPRQGKEKALVLEDAEKLTTEAQNALLKLLEEPPANTTVFLMAATDANFLLTVLSRCQIVSFSITPTLSQEEKSHLQTDLEKIISGTIGEKLSLAENLAKDKEGVGKWLLSVTLLVREKMIENTNDSKYPILLKAFLQAGKLYQTNINPRTLLERTFLDSFYIF